MYNFTLLNKTQIEFGKDAELKAGEYAAKYGKKALIHYGGGSVKKTGLFDRVKKSLEDKGITVYELGGVQPNPRVDLCRKGIELCRKEGIDVIIGLGGGSAVDSAKCISQGMYYEGDVWELCVGKAPSMKKKLPLIAIITMAGSGTEVSISAVISNETGMEKRGISGNDVRPDVALVNPELTYTLPSYQVAAGGVDIMAHCLERLISQSCESDITDHWAIAAAKTAIKFTPLALEKPTDYNVRSQLSYASMYAMMGWCHSGIKSDGFLHETEHELSGYFGVTHGAGLAALMPAYFTYCGKIAPKRIAYILHELFDAPYDFSDFGYTIKVGIERLVSFLKSVGMPTSLTELGVDTGRINDMAKTLVAYYGTVGNFANLNENQVAEVLTLAI